MTLRLRALWALGASFSLFACAHAPPALPVPPAGGYLSGKVSGLVRAAVLDDKDFVYGIALSPDGKTAAYTHMAGKTMNVGLWALEPEPAKLLADVVVNGYEWDVEGVDFAPDGSVVATGGRDGVVRLFDAKTGQRRAELYTEEPVVSVAFTPDGKHLLAGSARGLLTVLEVTSGPNGVEGAAYASEWRGHSDEVRAIVPLSDGRIVTGSWDKSVALFELHPAPLSASEVHLSIGQTLGPKPATVVRAGVDGKTGFFAYDATVPYVVVSSELARAAGIDPSLLTEGAQVLGRDARVAKGHVVNLKHLRVEGVDVAVCDACLPKGVHGILGAPVLDRFTITQRPAVGELVLTAKNPPDAGAALPEVPTLKELKRHTYEVFVNDVTADRAGGKLGVAFSKEKAERTLEMRQRERRNEAPPFNDEDVCAVVSTDDGKVQRKWHHHIGIVSSCALSPDGQSVASGGWDNRLYLLDLKKDRAVAKEELGWNVRRVRFSRDGRLVAVGAWTPQNAVGDQRSDPSALIYDVQYESVEVK